MHAHRLWPAGRPFARRHGGGAALAAALLPMVLLLWLDHAPRFMLGDSQSYLSAGAYGSYPPDRSWIFGVCVHGLMHMTRGLGAYVVLQVAMLGATVWLALRRLGRGGVAGPCILASALCVACDPLIETYARYYLSDLSAALLFIGFVTLLAAAVPRFGTGLSRPMQAGIWIGVFACGIGAVLFRLAYAPVEAATVLLAVAAHWRRRDWRVVPALAAACLVPLLGIGVLVQANRIVFATRFPGASFTNRSSGVFLMGVFSPALTAADIRRAGVDVTDREVAAMHLDDYANRINQVWGSQPFWLRNVVVRKLGVVDDYDARLDAAGKAMVAASFQRAPWGLASVYLHGLAMYAEPRQWRSHMEAETGLRRPLEPWFVDFLNARLDKPITAQLPEARSLLPPTLIAIAGLYPFVLLAGLAASLRALAGFGAPVLQLPAAAVVACVAVAPLYSTYVIPRYVLAAVFFTWVLLPPLYSDWLRQPAPGRS